MTKKLYRSKTDRVVAGIIGGMAEYFSIDANLLRVIFVIGVFATGVFPLVIAYVVGYFLIPESADHR